MAESHTCAADARIRNEALAGTVKPTGVYFLLETNAMEYGGWGMEIVKTASKSGSYAPLLQHLTQVKHSKVLFVRRPLSNQMNFFVAIMNQETPRLYQTELSGYNDLLKVDISSIAADSVPQVNGQPMQEIKELYAVCTNGKHDNCCSTYGIPFFNALVNEAGEDKVWQVSHIGGHRLAATMICFPQGIVYGQLDPLNAEEIVMNHQAGYMLNHKFRGWCSYGTQALSVDAFRAAQMAEYHIREQAKLYAISDLSLQSAIAQDESSWQISFVDKKGTTYQTLIEMSLSEPMMSSCDKELEPLPIYSVREYVAV